MNGKHLYTILLIIFVLFVVQGCKTESPVSPALTHGTSPSPPSPTATLAPSATRTPTVVVSPSPTVIVPTPTATLEPVETFLYAAPYNYHAGDAYNYSIDPYGVHGLEYLVYLAPDSEYRTSLIRRILLEYGFTGGIVNVDWLLADWVQENYLDPIHEAGEISAEMVEHWGLIETDWDGNQEPEYIFPMHIGASFYHTVLYWLHKQSGDFVLTEIARFREFSSPEITTANDINGDVFPDLVLEITHCGVSNCFPRMFIFTLREDMWTEIPILPEDWEPSNGDWYFEENDGKTELIATVKSADFPPGGITPPYEIIFQYIDGAFIPMDVREYHVTEPHPFSTTGGDFFKIQWSDKLLNLAFPERALEVLLKSELDPNSGYPPYIFFRMGMLSLYLGQIQEAKNVWTKIEMEMPDSLITQYIPSLKSLVAQPNPVWQVCNWLKANEITWYPDGYDPRDRLHPFADYYPFQWQKSCPENGMMRWQTWSASISRQQQIEQIGLAWTLLDETLDLNGDTLPDPIGILNNHIWAFLSNGTRYDPLLAGPQLPLQAIMIYEDYDLPADDFEINVISNLANTSVLVELVEPDRTAKLEWTGSYFSYDSGAISGDFFTLRYYPPSPDEPLTQALIVLFRDKQPQLALKLLKNYANDNEWLTLTARYVTAIALKYNGQEDLARLEFEAIMVDYPDTGWATFSREHLQP